MLNIYKTLIRPHLEYCVQVWSPYPRYGNWETIKSIEHVQRMFTRLIDGIGLLSYEERLHKLNLTTLLERRARGDLIETYRIVSGIAKSTMVQISSQCPEMDILLYLLATVTLPSMIFFLGELLNSGISFLPLSSKLALLTVLKPSLKHIKIPF